MGGFCLNSDRAQQYRERNVAISQLLSCTFH